MRDGAEGGLARLDLDFPTTPTENVTYVSKDGSRFHWGASLAGWWSNYRSANAKYCSCPDVSRVVAHTGFSGTPSALRLERTATDSFTLTNGGVETYTAKDVVELLHTPQ